MDGGLGNLYGPIRIVNPYRPIRIGLMDYQFVQTIRRKEKIGRNKEEKVKKGKVEIFKNMLGVEEI